MARQSIQFVYLVFREERHAGMSPSGITSRKDWAESWIRRDGGPSDTLSGPDFNEYRLDDPEVFPEARTEKGGALAERAARGEPLTYEEIKELHGDDPLYNFDKQA